MNTARKPNLSASVRNWLCRKEVGGKAGQTSTEEMKACDTTEKYISGSSAILHVRAF